jgi:hypothetical protein
MDASDWKEKLMPSPRFRQLVPIMCLIVSCSLWLGAQAQNPPAQAPAQDQQNQAPSGDDNLQTFKSEVNVVNLFFNVKDKHG